MESEETCAQIVFQAPTQAPATKGADGEVLKTCVLAD